MGPYLSSLCLMTLKSLTMTQAPPQEVLRDLSSSQKVVLTIVSGAINTSKGLILTILFVFEEDSNEMKAKLRVQNFKFRFIHPN